MDVMPLYPKSTPKYPNEFLESAVILDLMRKEQMVVPDGFHHRSIQRQRAYYNFRKPDSAPSHTWVIYEI